MSESVLDRPNLSPETKEQIAEADAKATANDASPEFKTVVKRLAALHESRYDQCRKEEAEKLNVRVGTLDEAVSKARDESVAVMVTAPGQGRPLDLPEPKPWPEPVDGAELLAELADTLRRHVVMTDEARDGAVLWVAWTWSIDRFDIAPKLLIKSPEKRCGKTTLLDFLLGTVCRPLSAASITAAAMFRTIEAAKPTLLIDEADSFMRENEELRGIVNSGHRKSQAFVIRCIGEDHEPRQFSTWCAMAIAGIGRQHGTVEDRSVVVTLKRKLPGEKVERFDDAARDRLAVHARQLARWAADHGEALAGARPEVPKELHDRAADNWRPLLAIADRAGGEWPKRARDAARKLSGSNDGDGVRVLLLADIKTLFAAKGEPEYLLTRDILEKLVAMDERPWPEWSKSMKPMTSRALALLLEPFEVRPFHVEKGGAYRRTSFKDAFDRYLPEGSAEAAGDATGENEGSAASSGLTPNNEGSKVQETSNGAGFAVSPRFRPPNGAEPSQGPRNPATTRVPEPLNLCEPRIRRVRL